MLENEAQTEPIAEVGGGGWRACPGQEAEGMAWAKVVERLWNACGTPMEPSRLQGAGCLFILVREGRHRVSMTENFEQTFLHVAIFISTHTRSTSH